MLLLLLFANKARREGWLETRIGKRSGRTELEDVTSFHGSARDQHAARQRKVEAHGRRTEGVQFHVPLGTGGADGQIFGELGGGYYL